MALLLTGFVFVPGKANADIAKAQCIKANVDGQSLRREGKLGDARAQFRVCGDASCPMMVRDDCAERLDELERVQPTVVFEIRDPAGNDLVDVAVLIDGHPLAVRLDGHAIPVDPGEHEFDFEVPGEPAAHQRLIVTEGSKGRRISVVVGKPVPDAARSPESAPAIPSRSGSSTEGAAHTRRTAGVVVGGVGLAAVAAGAIFGLLAKSAKDSFETQCGASVGELPHVCTQEGVAGHDDAATKATLSTVFFIGGGLAAATGAVLFISAPRSGPSTAVGLGPTGMFMSGRF